MRPGRRHALSIAALSTAAALIAAALIAAIAAALIAAAPIAADAVTAVPASAAEAATVAARPDGPPATSAPAREARPPCDHRDPLRQPFFGDLHVHTARSQDASTQDTRTSPADAYRFARGAALGIQPFDAEGRPLRRVQLARPLDFAAVTDHAEQIGEVHLCNTPDSAGYDSLVCRTYRRFPRLAFFVMNGRYSMLGSRWGFCGEGAVHCLEAAGVVWKEHRDAAAAAYDRSSDCAFTSFVAYEWTAARGRGGHLHRNVVFRNASVPELPISVMETGPMAIELWRRLDAECRDGRPGCEAITIPHNSNWSDGSAFSSAHLPGEEITAEEAPLRARYDRLVEMIQHKGESECALYPGTSDEGCAFEKAPNPFAPDAAPEPIDYARDALERGLALEATLGVNPLAFGQIGSTDTHLGTPGLVAERGHPGHGGAGKPGNRVFGEPGFQDIPSLNPGGLAVLWAEENTRDALFDAMLRREVYATSGTRPTLRLFGGWDFGEASCADASAVPALGYAGGVPMGGALPPRPAGAVAPTFLIAAGRDPHAEGADLERIEIVKGWVEDGERKETVLTVAGGDTDASVDLATCERRGRGHGQLCTVWRDPDFDPEEPAFYYARLRESPSCRWTQWACLDAGIRCEDPATVTSGYEACCTGELEPTIQERAWSSPIWYRPATETAQSLR